MANVEQVVIVVNLMVDVYVTDGITVLCRANIGHGICLILVLLIPGPAEVHHLICTFHNIVPDSFAISFEENHYFVPLSLCLTSKPCAIRSSVPGVLVSNFGSWVSSKVIQVSSIPQHILHHVVVVFDFLRIIICSLVPVGRIVLAEMELVLRSLLFWDWCRDIRSEELAL